MKNIIYVLVTFVLGFVLIKGFSVYFENNKTIVCAKFKGEGGIRGSDTYVFDFVYRNKKYIGSIYLGDLRLKDKNKLKKIKCIEFECSMRFPSINKCIDKRVIR